MSFILSLIMNLLILQDSVSALFLRNACMRM